MHPAQTDGTRARRARERARRRHTRLYPLLALLLATAVLGSAELATGGPSRTGVRSRGARRSRTARMVGCTAGGSGVVNSGPGGRPDVALTFDDGPSRFTPSILRILDRRHARATFFEEGRHIPGRARVARRILANGDEIGNHSLTHPRDPGYRQLRVTNRRIRRATGFRPCLFRPPYGLINARVTSAARRTRLRIVEWSVDSRDDKRPGVGAIVSRTLSLAAPGSIILMHDGGRHRSETVAALPRILRGLRARGLHLRTLSALLGGRMVRRGASASTPARAG